MRKVFFISIIEEGRKALQKMSPNISFAEQT
jgi:hypothetical protein